MAAERVRAAAAGLDLDVEIFARQPAGSLAEAAAVLGIRPADIVKSLVLKRPDDTFLFALIPGDRQISWPKLRTAVGVNRLSMPSPHVALQATGYERGTITPLGSTTAWPVFADAAMLGQRVAMGAGEHGFSLFVQADELVAALEATVLDISEPT
jgi:Cys-tRNA(Pro) deacylase